MSNTTANARSGEVDPEFPTIAIPNPAEGERDLSAILVKPHPNGGFVLGCQNELYGQAPCLVRILADNSLDTGFGEAGYAYIDLSTESLPETDGYLMSIHMLTDGKLLARLETSVTLKGRHVTCLVLARFTGTGDKDPEFGSNGLQIHPLLGLPSVLPEPLRQPVRRVPEPREPRFPYEEYGDISVLADGKLLVLTTARDLTENTHRPYVLRLTDSGALDPTFNGNGLMEPDSYMWFKPYRMLVQSDDKLVISGEHPGIHFIARFDQAGTLDTTFGNNGYFTDLELGNYDYSSFLKLLPDGSGNLVCSGQRGSQTPTERGVTVVCKIDSNGHAAADFNAGKTVVIEPREVGKAVLSTFDSFIDDSNRIVLGGRHLFIGENIGMEGFVARLLANGQPDTSIAPDGVRYLTQFSSLLHMTPSLDSDNHYYATASPVEGYPPRLYRLIA